MIDQVLFGADIGASDKLGRMVMNVLAVAGAAAVGGFGIGFLTQLVARLTFAKPLPRPALNLLRVAGAITAGLLAALVIWQDHSGFGFGGGFGLGGRETGSDGAGKNTESRSEALRGNGADPTAGPGVLRIEVLGDQAQERTHFYRLESVDPKARLTLEEVRTRIRERQSQSPPLERLVIVLFLDSPDKDKKQVRDLQEMALDFKLRPVIDAMNSKAP
jgi:hypothetical protein